MSTQTKDVVLADPIPYGDEKLAQITLRRPQAGDLRGIKLMGLHQADVDTVLTIIPRISTPHVTMGQLFELSGADLVVLAEAVTTFFSREGAA